MVILLLKLLLVFDVMGFFLFCFFNSFSLLFRFPALLLLGPLSFSVLVGLIFFSFSWDGCVGRVGVCGGVGRELVGTFLPSSVAQHSSYLPLSMKTGSP